MIHTLVKKIIQNPLFLRLKDIVENNTYHDYEDAYSHSIKTKDIALKQITGDFISNPKAKEKFVIFTNENIHDIKRADAMILVVLLHDIGKILYVKDGDTTYPLLVVNSAGLTTCPGHEYWGSTIVTEILKDLALNKMIVKIFNEPKLYEKRQYIIL